MRHLSAVLIIVLLVVLPSCKYFKRGKAGGGSDTMAVWQVRQDSTRVADSIRKVHDRLLAIESAKLDSARRADDERLAWESKFRYNIIVGSFLTPEYAKAMAQDYRTKGYDTKIVKMKDSRFELVSAEAHDSFRKAVARLKEFQDTIELDSWMYIIK